jgi:type IV fimbrial biogenesis protein FimT
VLTAGLRQDGVSLIEMIIGLAILAVLTAASAPSFSQWIQNTRIRSAAESLSSAVQQARSEAVRRNAIVRFQLTDTATSSCALSATGPNWIISREDATGRCDAAVSETVAPMIIQKSSGNEALNVSVAVTPTAQTSIAFNGFGRVSPVPASDVALNITNPAAGACATQGGGGPVRCLRVVVSAAGQIRMCDPARVTNDPQGC